MQQTFLGYVTTDLRFWASSIVAIGRSILVPLAGASVLFGLAGGPVAVAYAFAAALAFALADWCVLVVRMARRVALGLEAPNDLLDRSVLGNAAYLHQAYYAGPMPRLDAVRGRAR